LEETLESGVEILESGVKNWESGVGRIVLRGMKKGRSPVAISPDASQVWSILYLLNVLPTTSKSTTTDEHFKLLTSIPPFKQSTMKEPLCKPQNNVIREGSSTGKVKSTHKILSGAVLSCKPHPFFDSSPHISVMLLKESQRPVGVTSTSEWITAPLVEEDGGGLWYIHTRIHSVKCIHELFLNFILIQ